MVLGLSPNCSKIRAWEATSPENTPGGWGWDTGLWRLTDQGESPGLTDGRSSDPHTGDPRKVIQVQKTEHLREKLSGRPYRPALMHTASQEAGRLWHLWARSLNVAVYFLIHFYLTVSTLHSSDLLASRIKEISFIFLLDQHVHKYLNAKSVNL